MSPNDVQTADFAPGDQRAKSFSWDGFTLHTIRSADHPFFAQAFEALWNQFAPACEMEEKQVIEARLRRWQTPHGGGDLIRYELLLVKKDGELAAVRDHAVIIPERPEHFSAMLHLSHNLVFPAFRRTGLAGWMRAFPVASARMLLDEMNRASDLPIVLVAEMEPPDPEQEETMIRLKAYEKAGFLKGDPARVAYLQPDFRSTDKIDRSGVEPVPMQIVLRITGRESAREMSLDMLRSLLESLYGMFALEFRPADLAVAKTCMEKLSGDFISLVPPTAP